MQLTHNATDGKVGVAGFFSQYVKFLPSKFPLPTFWDDSERNLIKGTSLENALASKLSSLDREFDLVREKTFPIVWCQRHWWDNVSGIVSFEDWKTVDAMYRSRALDLPGTGHATVPFIDMANHASGEATTALYETDPNGNALLILRDGKTINHLDEITITYGDEKGACEMLFSYGFLEEPMSSAQELFLDLNIPEDDPLKLAKQKIAKSAPGFRLFEQDNTIAWEGPYIWLLCANEDDGLEFRVLQTVDGRRELSAAWNGLDLQDSRSLQMLMNGDPRKDLFQLRAVSVLQLRVEEQLLRFEASRVFAKDFERKDLSNYWAAMKLRDLEETLMLHAYEVFEEQVKVLRNTIGDALVADAESENATDRVVGGSRLLCFNQ